MKNIVVGTAGHIDHGKTALVRALTGIDTDRLKEEKRRGISIDLGFAHLTLPPQVRVAFIDVPGHERFIKNMLAGVGGIDAVLFVIAADESVKPQTREHFDICRLLGVRRGIIAITKSDAVDQDILQLVRLEIEEFVAGSFLENAPMFAVSATTGEGLEDLRTALSQLASGIAARDDTQYLRIPVDRSFVMQGFGTVVTGTVTAGTVAREQEVQVYPGGRILRVRGVQVHGAAAKRAVAGQRAALNVTGAEHSELRRGHVLADPGRLRETTRVDCRFELLASAKPVKDRAPVHLHAGTAEAEAEVRTLRGQGPIEPGSSTFVRLVLREPLLLLPGDRFIVRMFSPVMTIGGGEVIDLVQGSRLHRAAALSRAQALAGAEIPERIGWLVRESSGGLSMDDLIARTGLRPETIRAGAPTSVLLLEGSPPWLFDRAAVEAILDRWRDQLAAFHSSHPLLPGIRREEMRSREMPDVPAWVFDAILARGKAIVATADVLHLASHKIALKQEEEEALARIEAAFAEAGLAVPGLGDVLATCGVESARARSLLQILLRQKRLIRVSEDLVFHPAALGRLRGSLGERRGQRFSVGEFKEWTGISRKYAIPLLEYLDRERITLRNGDARMVL